MLDFLPYMTKENLNRNKRLNNVLIFSAAQCEQEGIDSQDPFASDVAIAFDFVQCKQTSLFLFPIYGVMCLRETNTWLSSWWSSRSHLPCLDKH